MFARINTFVIMGLGERGDRDIIIGSAKQDLSKMEIEIQTLDQGEAIISTIGIPFLVSTRIHTFENYITTLNTERKQGSLMVSPPASPKKKYRSLIPRILTAR